MALSGDARVCYRARLLDQRAYRAARGWRAEPARLAAARALIEAIPVGGPPFAVFRRSHSLAWCLWRQGDPAALASARAAVTAAGDGGYLRFRRMGLELLARIAEGEEAARARARAAAIGAALDG